MKKQNKTKQNNNQKNKQANKQKAKQNKTKTATGRVAFELICINKHFWGAEKWFAPKTVPE